MGLSWQCCVAPLLGIVTVAGCAARRHAAPAAPPEVVAAAATRPAAVPVVSSTETLPLDQILPRAELSPAATRPTTGPTSGPAGRAPMEALELYARAVDELRAQRRQSAAALLEKAVALDPNSFELHFALGRAYLPGGGYDDRSIASLSRAAEIRPDDLDVQTELGRQLVAKGETERGLWHLRLAAKTSRYAAEDPAGAVTELYLGRTLARAGYHAAAVEVYERLRRRLENPTAGMRALPEVAYLASHPELLRLQVAESYERLGRHEQALAAYEAVLAKDPTQRGLVERVVSALLALRRFDEAAARAAGLLAALDGDASALDPLREVAGAAGENSPAAMLERLRRRRPDDRSVLLAYADVLNLEKRHGEAWAVLSDAAEMSPADAAIIERLYRTAWNEDPAGARAARFLVGWSAQHPEASHVLERPLADLVRPTRSPRVTLRSLRELTRADAGDDDAEAIRKAGGPGSPGGSRAVPAAVGRWEAAKQYWVWHLAQARHRRDVAHAALRQSVNSAEVFPPAWRSFVDVIWEEPGRSPDEKGRAVDGLASRAAGAGDRSLAAELRGLSLLHQGRLAEARDRFREAVAATKAPPPELRLAYAASLRDGGDFAGFERELWEVAGKWPRFEPAFEALYRHHDSRGESTQAAKVLGAWVTADADSVDARLLEAREFIRLGQFRSAVALMNRLLADNAEDPRVLVTVRALYTQGGQLESFLSDLQQRHAKHPANLAAAAQLADVYNGQRRVADATRVLDATRAALSGGAGAEADPDLLYELAHLYTMVGQAQASEQVLREVLRLDADHAPAANDLGYVLADEGRELEAAEAMTRRAVEADPRNASFLDSLGWVLYKRGRLEEARRALSRAVELSEEPGADPVVLDHLGDALYQLGESAAAAEHWKRAAQRLGEMSDADRQRDEHQKLRLRLDRKTRQAEAGQPVSVAPVVEKPARRPPSVSQPPPEAPQSTRGGVE